VYFASGRPQEVVLFGDGVDLSIEGPNGIPVGDGLYSTTTPINETRKVTTFPTGYVVSNICTGSSFPFVCGTDHVPPITSLTISFTRPNPQPNIYINGATTTGNFPAACIEVRSPKAPLPGATLPGGHIRSVQIYNSGMIRSVVGKCNNAP
jgi:hypothetical protein